MSASLPETAGPENALLPLLLEDCETESPDNVQLPGDNETESPDNAQLPGDNESSVKLANKKAKTSWVWAYWDEEEQEIKGVLRQVIVCKVIDTANQTQCRKTYIKSSGSTGNAISHLRNKHDITKDGKIEEVC